MIALTTERLRLEVPEPSRAVAEAVADYFARNRAFHGPWDPPRPDGFTEPAHWEAQLVDNAAQLEARTAARFFLFEGDRVVGNASFSVIGWGPFCAANLGYAICEGRAGRGLMTEALRRLLTWAFEWGLHRVQANHLPTNVASARLLRRLGFTVDGYARDYLFIDGAWRDHVLTSITAPER